MDKTRTVLVAAAAVCLGAVVCVGSARGQVKDAIWEKTYCLDERGTAIQFSNERTGEPPRVVGIPGNVVIEGDHDMLDSLSYEAAQFLFARVCIEAASMNIKGGLLVSPELECRTTQFLARRFNIGLREMYRVVEELGARDSTRLIARNLDECL